MCKLTKITILLILSIILSSSKNLNKKLKQINDLKQINLQKKPNNSYTLALTIGHNTLQLNPILTDGKLWIKQAKCKICTSNQKCLDQGSCFQNKNQPKILCDSAFCDKGQQFGNDQLQIYGTQVQIISKINGKQMIMLDMALINKTNTKYKQIGNYYLFDKQTSFNHGILKQENHTLSILNMEQNKQTQNQIKKNLLETITFKNIKQFKQKQIINLQISKQDKTIQVDQANNHKIQFSLQQLGIIMSSKLFSTFNKQIINMTMPKQCKIINSKLKCKEQISFSQLKQTKIQILIQKQSKLSFPLQMLIGQCNKLQCNLLINSHNKQNLIIIGTFIWQAMILQWNLVQNTLIFYRINNQWADLYRQIKLQQNFLVNTYHILIHIIKIVVKIIIFLAGLSIVLNIILRWNYIMRWIKSLVKSRQEEDQNIGLSTNYNLKNRRGKRLPQQQPF